MMDAWIKLLLTLAGAPVSYLIARKIYDDVYERIRVWQADQVALDEKREQAQYGIVYPDERGRWPMLRDPEGNWRDPNTMRAFTLQVIRETYPGLEQMDATIRALLAAQGTPNGAASPLADLSDVITPAFAWPSEYEYHRMARKYLKRPSWRDLLLGVTYDKQGVEKPVMGDMEDLIHIMIGGASGWGKSNLEYVLARQLVESTDPCRLVFVDFAGTTLAPLSRSDRLLFPVAQDHNSALHVFREMRKELQSRKEQFVDYPGVQNLTQYNQTTDNDLEPWFLFVDETPSLMRHHEIRDIFTEIAEQSRKFGMGLICCGTTWHARVIPEPIRVNFSTRAAMWCPPSTSHVILEDGCASDIEQPGRMWIRMPGEPMQEVLSPMASFDVINGNGPGMTVPKTGGDLDNFASKVKDAWDSLDRPNIAAVCRELGMHEGGADWRKVKYALIDMELIPR